MESINKSTVILGSQWGDEGKGKIVDLLAKDFDIVARTGGGSNAGHTIKVGDQVHSLHLIPSGILYDSTKCVIGNGVVVHIPSLLKELENLKGKFNVEGRIFISDRAHLLFNFHQEIDGLNESSLGVKKIGTTKKGIGPCYSTKAERIGLRIGDLLNFDEVFVPRFTSMVESIKTKFQSVDIDLEKEITQYREYAEFFKPFIIDTVEFIYQSFNQSKRIMIEGANATMLDIDFGTYPFVTSSSPSIGGCLTGLGIPPSRIGTTIGIVKAYTTRVGEGPFPTELFDDVAKHFQDVGREFGTTTGRKRRCGWLDLVQLTYSTKINGFTSFALTKLDILSGLKTLKIGVKYTLNGKEISFPGSLHDLSEVKVEYKELEGWDEDISKCRSFDDLPDNAKMYVKEVEKQTGVKVQYIGVGPERNDIIVIN